MSLAADEPGALRVLAVFATVVVMTIGSVVVLNVVVDPRSEFPGQRFLPLVLDEPALRLQLYGDLSEPPATLVFGSSRATKILPGQIENHTGRPAFNFANSGGAMHDGIAIYRYLRQQGTPPSEIVWGLDTEFLQPGRGPAWVVRSSAELGPYTGYPVSPTEHIATLWASFTWTYVKDSVKAVRYAVVGQPGSPNFVIAPDGHVIYPLDDPHVGHESYPLAERLAASISAHQYARYTAPGEREVADLEEFLHEASVEGTTVRIFLTPMHPDLLNALAGSRFLAANEATLAALAALCAPGIHIHDLTTIESFGGDATGWYDDRHYSEANAARVVDSLYSGASVDVCAGT